MPSNVSVSLLERCLAKCEASLFFSLPDLPKYQGFLREGVGGREKGEWKGILNYQRKFSLNHFNENKTS